MGSGMMSMSCPQCGSGLEKAEEHEDKLRCEMGHLYSLPMLLIAQTARAATLFGAGCKLLEEQERLVRSIMKQLDPSQTDALASLDEECVRLLKAISVIKDALKAKERRTSGHGITDPFVKPN